MKKNMVSLLVLLSLIPIGNHAKVEWIYTAGNLRIKPFEASIATFCNGACNWQSNWTGSSWVWDQTTSGKGVYLKTFGGGKFVYYGPGWGCSDDSCFCACKKAKNS